MKTFAAVVVGLLLPLVAQCVPADGITGVVAAEPVLKPRVLSDLAADTDAGVPAVKPRVPAELAKGAGASAPAIKERTPADSAEEAKNLSKRVGTQLCYTNGGVNCRLTPYIESWNIWTTTEEGYYYYDCYSYGADVDNN
jgi:hypothetical protein